MRFDVAVTFFVIALTMFMTSCPAWAYGVLIGWICIYLAVSLPAKSKTTGEDPQEQPTERKKTQMRILYDPKVATFKCSGCDTVIELRMKDYFVADYNVVVNSKPPDDPEDDWIDVHKVHCPNCDSWFNNEEDRIKPKMSFTKKIKDHCSSCGTELGEGDKHCSSCGAPTK